MYKTLVLDIKGNISPNEAALLLGLGSVFSSGIDTPRKVLSIFILFYYFILLYFV